MTRDEIVQHLISRFASPAYLEVGVDHGLTFHTIRAHHKTAVDPHFKFDIEAARVQNPDCTYVDCSSDEFFSSHANGRKYDVIYLDGLHTFGQTLRDLINSIGALAENGIILIDDVLPSTYSASLPSLEDTFRVREFVESERSDGSWMGDVYKLVFFIAAYVPQFSYATVQENHGQLVMWRAPRSADLTFGSQLKDIAMMDFADMLAKMHIFRRRPFAQIIEELDQGFSGLNRR